MSSPKIIEVVAAVIVEDGKVFATQRGPDMKLPGMWEFPGGKIEADESPEAALAREILEELDCEITIDKKILTTDHSYDFGDIRLTTFWCELQEGRPSLVEHSQARWLSPNELHSLTWAPADVPAVEQIFEFLA